MSARLSLAIEQEGLTLPASGPILVLHPRAGADLAALPRERTLLIQPFRPDHDFLTASGFPNVAWMAPGAHRFAAALVCLPRAKRQAQALIAQAARQTDGVVIVDGAKTDGADSLMREVRKRVPLDGALSKSHGRIFWFRTDAAGFDASAFADWAEADTQRVGGFVTAPGVFSADGIDPASEMLAQALPRHLGAHVADLGAGWGYLATRLLADDRLESLDLIEADRIALTCAMENVRDPRARFHWVDAALFRAAGPLDAVVTNPPFHTGRAADPSLGQSFIQAAARLLGPQGQLWLVANRHLPYEAALEAGFTETQEVAGDGRFKVLRAARPRRVRG
ncbi:class I SAM-dependent methyltransferase [Antarcticimicrobium luteum]|uniref:Class I SAM-dependent methyltransferase n=1 Tax=Antarcticimicrobium luteum TaxID=2547397 RepID=A0A4R5V8W9_9RHOB|nr:methyltransferase [Antarcticimicrobium luteum]TDK48075.1 class I SAM-dependent methyltransferase [Antarcticimicrobium luteum]